MDKVTGAAPVFSKSIVREDLKKVKEKRAELADRSMTVVGTIMCILLIPVLIINVTLIIRSYTNSGQVVGIGGYTPLIVMTDSMNSDIKGGDLIICHSIEAESIKVGDVIAFIDPDGSSGSIVTHRVVEITTEDGELAFRTQGDANNTADKSLVTAADLIGVYTYKLAGIGTVALFMQTTMGLIVCVLIPIAVIILYDAVRRYRYDRRKQAEADALLAELEELRAKGTQLTLDSIEEN